MKSTALEILSEPLTLLLLLTALSLIVFAPTFHYHQFGEATRMARDAGLSALFTCGSILAVFSTIRSFRREIESGTREMALAHPVSEVGFFLSKTAGACCAVIVFSLILFSTSVTIVEGARVAGELQRTTGSIATVWGPCVASGTAIVLLPLVIGALVNRFRRGRFVLTAIKTALVLACLSAVVFSVRISPDSVVRLFPAGILIVAALFFALFVAAATSSRFAANTAATITAFVVLAALPFIGNYYLANALSRGGTIGFGYLFAALAALLPAYAAVLIIGAALCKERE